MIGEPGPNRRSEPEFANMLHWMAQMPFTQHPLQARLNPITRPEWTHVGVWQCKITEFVLEHVAYQYGRLAIVCLCAQLPPPSFPQCRIAICLESVCLPGPVVSVFYFWLVFFGSFPPPIVSLPFSSPPSSLFFFEIGIQVAQRSLKLAI